MVGFGTTKKALAVCQSEEMLISSERGLVQCSQRVSTRRTKELRQLTSGLNFSQYKTFKSSLHLQTFIADLSNNSVG